MIETLLKIQRNLNFTWNPCNNYEMNLCVENFNAEDWKKEGKVNGRGEGIGVDTRLSIFDPRSSMAKRSPIYGYTRRSRIGWPQWIGSRWSISTLANCKLTGHQSTLVDTGDSRRRSSLPIRDGRSPVPLFAPVRQTFSTKVQRPALAALLLGRRNFGKGSDGSFAAFEFFDEFPVSWSKNHHRSDRIE